MIEHDDARRAFLLRAAMTAVAGAGVGTVPAALAQTHDHATQAAASIPATGHASIRRAASAPSSTPKMPPRSRPSPNG